MAHDISYLQRGDAAIRDTYLAEGYCVIKSVFDAKLIDDLLRMYRQDIVTSKTKFYRQNTNRYEANKVSSHGHVQQSFLDIHDYGAYQKFSSFARSIFGHQNIQECLRIATGSTAHSIMQTMLFDQNVGTPPHQDWWYLDSRPSGNLIAAWIALEDIHPDAGNFYLLPRSMHHHPLDPDPNIKHSDWLAKIKDLTTAQMDQVHTPKMSRGDVILWNSRTIHGSHQTKDAKHSRKSLTCHYLPQEFSFGNIFKDKPYVKLTNKDGILFYRNQPDYTFAVDMKFRFKNAVYNSPLLLKALRAFQR